MEIHHNLFGFTAPNHPKSVFFGRTWGYSVLLIFIPHIQSVAHTFPPPLPPPPSQIMCMSTGKVPSLAFLIISLTFDRRRRRFPNTTMQGPVLRPVERWVSARPPLAWPAPQRLPSLASQNWCQRGPSRSSGLIPGVYSRATAGHEGCGLGLRFPGGSAGSGRAPPRGARGLLPGRGCGAGPSWGAGSCPLRPAGMDEDGLPIVGSGIDLTKVRAALARLSGAAAPPPRRPLRWPWCWASPGSPPAPGPARRQRARGALRAVTVPPSLPGRSGLWPLPVCPAVFRRHFASSSVITLYLKTKPFQASIWEANPVQSCLLISFNVAETSFLNLVSSIQSIKTGQFQLTQ